MPNVVLPHYLTRFRTCIYGALITLISIYVFLSFCRMNTFVTADLGRHLMNGKMILSSGKVPTTNYYSYTEPDFPTIMHHWGSGVIFYLVHAVSGFKGLSLFYILVSLMTVALFMWGGIIRGGTFFVFLSGLLAVPLLAERTDIRPEGLSALYMSMYYVILALPMSTLKKRALWVLPFMQIVWVNTHVFFPMGFFIIGVFIVEAWLKHESWKELGMIGILTVCASFINPYGVAGVIEPFTIFKEYGYMVAENQSLLFMQKRFGFPVYSYLEVLLACTGGITLGVFMIKRGRRFVADLILVIVYGIFVWRMIRGVSFFGCVMIPVMAHGLALLYEPLVPVIKQWMKGSVVVACVMICAIGIVGKKTVFSAYDPLMGIGLQRGVNDAAEFMNRNKVEGPLFNNYDSGGYLIYHLFPDVRPFVDNRPEAYSVSFFKNIYEPMQEHEAVWHEMDARWNFNSIFFYRHDMTTHAQPFLIRRIDDPQWAPVYVDDYSIILLKRNEKNRPIIDQYELPKSMFVVTKG